MACGITVFTSSSLSWVFCCSANIKSSLNTTLRSLHVISAISPGISAMFVQTKFGLTVITWGARLSPSHAVLTHLGLTANIRGSFPIPVVFLQTTLLMTGWVNTAVAKSMGPSPLLFYQHLPKFLNCHPLTSMNYHLFQLLRLLSTHLPLWLLSQPICCLPLCLCLLFLMIHCLLKSWILKVFWSHLKLRRNCLPIECLPISLLLHLILSLPVLTNQFHPLLSLENLVLRLILLLLLSMLFLLCCQKLWNLTWKPPSIWRGNLWALCWSTLREGKANLKKLLSALCLSESPFSELSSFYLWMQGVLLAPSLIIFCLIWSRLPIFWSPASGRQGGGVTLILSKCSDEIVSWKKDSHGRIISILIRSNDVDVNLVNIYAPTNLADRKICFDSLHEFLFLPLPSSSQGILTAMIMLLINLVETFLFTKNTSHWKMTV